MSGTLRFVAVSTKARGHVCPHCDSPNTEQMRKRAYELSSAVTWYQCCGCQRMWSVAKHLPIPSSDDNDNSPES
jgi:hypothetical protein